jgi:hypothetical protein
MWYSYAECHLKSTARGGEEKWAEMRVVRCDVPGCEVLKSPGGAPSIHLNIKEVSCGS